MILFSPFIAFSVSSSLILQIETLIRWEREMDSKMKNPTISHSRTEMPVDILIRFLQACCESQQLWKQFFWSIYRPLRLVFEEEAVMPLARTLERVLNQWSSLLGPGPINHRMLSEQSAEAVHNMNLTNKPRSTQFSLILRLVPDFAVKGCEAFFLAKTWRRVSGLSGYTRELECIKKMKMASKLNIGPLYRKKSLTPAIFHTAGNGLKSTLMQSSEKVGVVGHHAGRHPSREIDLDSKCGLLERGAISTEVSEERRIDSLREILKRERLSVQKIRAQLFRRRIYPETETLMDVPLLEKLASAKSNCRRLRNKISNAESLFHRPPSVGERQQSSLSNQAALNSFKSNTRAQSQALAAGVRTSRNAIQRGR